MVGASAGGVEALKALVGRLPRGLPAAVFVACHFPVDESERTARGALRTATQQDALTPPTG